MRGGAGVPGGRGVIVGAVLGLLLSCQTFFSGERPEDLLREGGYGGEEFHRFLLMCRSVWREYETFPETGWSLEYIRHDGTNTLGGLLRKGDLLYVIFRGSQAPGDRTDLGQNLRFLPRRPPFGDQPSVRIHRGFLEKYLGIRDDLHQALSRDPPGRIVFVGHSGGGALGVIAFYDLVGRLPEIEMSVVTFGMPRVFNRAGAAWFQEHHSRVLRIVMGRDAIAGVPPAFLGFRHVGRLVRVGDRSLLPLFSFRDHWPGYRDFFAPPE
ncbi:lipase family protein [Alkalispirochaeta sphaeroplastigenens]|uniref:lipase family protein n=1 Tax=Alkalispirochaeta sphaeroplastigenens TaxID=1187066 RepID=UPI0011AFBBD2|nr:lipase family protein [Alkalispirochaeta sphaeroplastigenens]